MQGCPCTSHCLASEVARGPASSCSNLPLACPRCLACRRAELKVLVGLHGETTKEGGKRKDLEAALSQDEVQVRLPAAGEAAGGGVGPALGLLTGSGNRCARPVAVLRFALLGCARHSCALPTNWRHAGCTPCAGHPGRAGHGLQDCTDCHDPTWHGEVSGWAAPRQVSPACPGCSRSPLGGWRRAMRCRTPACSAQQRYTTLRLLTSAPSSSLHRVARCSCSPATRRSMMSCCGK